MSTEITSYNDGYGIPNKYTEVSYDSMKFAKGEYTLNDKLINDTQWKFIWQKTQAGFVKWTKGERPDFRTAYICQGEEEPLRDEFGEDDKSKWEIGLDGKPRDPWSHVFRLILENQAGDLAELILSSYYGKRAANVLLDKVRRAGLRTPIVRLESEKVSTKFGPVAAPKFEITGFVEDESPPAFLAGKTPSSGGSALSAAELDEEIPF